MDLGPNHLEKLIQVAKKAALQAGKLIKESLHREVEVKIKDTGSTLSSSVVTEVDLLAQKAILKIITPTLNEYDLGLLTEESSDNHGRFSKDYFWSIDPLDGTLPFTEKRNGFSVSIALVKKSGIPIIGVVYDPMSDSLYHSIKDMGAYKNEIPLKIKTENQAKTFNLYINRSFKNDERYNEFIQKIQSLEFKEINTTSHAGSVLNTCWCLENPPSCYVVLPKKADGGGSLWDFAACSLIMSEALGVVSDCFNGPIELNRKESTFLNHRGILMASDKEIHEQISKCISNMISAIL